MDELLSEFITETSEFLETVDSQLVIFEADPSDLATLNNIFRLVHTIKGTCGFLGLPRLQSVAHAGETLLGKFRNRSLVASTHQVQLVMACIDRIKDILAEIEINGKELEGDDSALILALEHSSASGVSLSGPEGKTLATDNALLKVEQPLTTPPTFERRSNPIARALANEDDETGAKHGVGVASQSIRVNVDVLDSLVKMVSELTSTRNQLMQTVRNTGNNALTAPLQRLSDVTAELQDCVMKTRMQPIASAWKKLPRIVHDAGRDLGKKIELVLEGEATELDRRVVELIKDPLTHMIRNACDHGLESTNRRLFLGKPETGTIKLHAFHQGGHVIIEVCDDGSGLSTSRIRDEAIKSGIVSAQQAWGLSDQQIHRLIFEPGISTAQAITSISGRGVGMDVVRTNIELMGGTIDLLSSEGIGTKFVIKVPRILAPLHEQAFEGLASDLFSSANHHVADDSGIGLFAKHVVLIEPSPFFRSLIAPLLRAAGYDVDAVQTSSAALLCVQHRRPHAILMDIDADPASARRLLKDKQLNGIKILALTGQDEADATGFEALVQKTDRANLIACIGRATPCEAAA